MQTDQADVIVVGAGSGGFGAALAAARLGLKLLLVEPADMLGGTSTRAGVSVWEMGCGGTGIPFDLYCRLKTIPHACGLYSIHRHCCWPEDGAYPGGEQLIAPALRYRDSLCRHALGALSYGNPADKPLIRQRWHGVVYEPAAMARVMEAMLRETGRVTVLKGTSWRGVQVHQGRIEALTLDTGDTVRAAAYIDATGDATLCAAAGCSRLEGEDPRSRFGEPAAPAAPTGRVNGVTLIFRVAPRPLPGVDPLPHGIPASCWWRPSFPLASVTEYPNGDLHVNMLPTMEGREYLDVGAVAAYDECRRRVFAFWHHYQRVFPEWQRFGITWLAPALGVRETARVEAEYMLTQLDLEAGLEGQQHADIVAINDHTMDVHGTHNANIPCRGVHSAYGVPYRCLVPKGWSNLLVACRAAGFSSLAASSCRLQRVIMTLGQAAGTAAALAKQTRCALPEVDASQLRDWLRSQHVQLDWPMPAPLAQHVGDSVENPSPGCRPTA